MRILIATGRPADFADFLAALAEAGAQTHLAPTARAALKQAQAQPPSLVVADENLADGDPFAFVARLMRQNAAIATAVVTRLSPEAFHQAGEGLGILASLPPIPTAQDARALLTALAALGHAGGAPNAGLGQSARGKA